jgi:hypothetical protein
MRENCGVSLTSTQWHIVNPGAVFGLRFYKPLTGDVRTFCSDQFACYALR